VLRLGYFKNVLKQAIPLANRNQLILEKQATAAGLKLTTRDLFYDLEKSNQILRIRRSHNAYLSDMISNFDFFVNSVVPVWEGGKTLVDMSGPRYHRLKGFTDIPLLFPSLTEPYVTTEEYLSFANLSAGQTVLDLGAYSAVTSISFAQRVGPTGRVFAFEADQVNYECATENVRIAENWMGINNITLINKAIWSHDNGIEFSNELAMGSGALEITGGGRGTATVVPSTTLESFCVEHGVDRFDFIKIDIEGAEVQVLEHSTKLLAQMKSRMVIEPHVVDGSLCTDRCCAMLEQAGYGVRLMEQTGMYPPLILATPK